jgi:hypothetical protein
METKGRIDRYTVDHIWIVQPEDVWVIDPTPVRSVTLVTCYPFYFIGSAPQRYIVRATLSSDSDGGCTVGSLCFPSTQYRYGAWRSVDFRWLDGGSHEGLQIARGARRVRDDGAFRVFGLGSDNNDVDGGAETRRGDLGHR